MKNLQIKFKLYKSTMKHFYNNPTNENFNFIFFSEDLKIEHGWKIHVSAHCKNYQKVLNKSINYCINNKLDCKYINNYPLFLKSISKDFKRTSSGKFITIYFENTNQFKFHIKNLYKILKGFDGPYIYTDRKYRTDSNIYYRYGSFLNPNNQLIFNGKEYIDIKGPSYSLPEFVKEPFNIKQKKILKVDNFFKKYEILGAVKFSNSGGIYKALNKQTNNFVLIKEVRKYIIDSIETSKTAYELRLNEYNLTKRFKYKYFLNPIEKLTINYLTYFVFDYLDGLSVDYQYDILSLISINFQNKYKDNLFLIYKNLYDKLLEIYSFSSSKSLVLNDIADFNFIKIKDDIFFIDMEHSFVLSNKKKHKFIKNKFFTDTRKESEKSDLMKISYLIIEIITSSNSLLEFDQSGNRLLTKFDYIWNIHNFDKKLLFDILKNLKIKKFIKYDIFQDEQKKIINEIKLILKDVSIDKTFKDYDWIDIENFNNPLSDLFTNTFLEFYKNNINEINDLSSKELYKLCIINFLFYKKQKEIDLIIEKILTKFFCFENGSWFVKNDKYFFPFLLDGTLGFFYILLKYKNFFNSGKYDLYFNNAWNSILYFANKFDVRYGLSGILQIDLWIKNKKLNFSLPTFRTEIIVKNFFIHLFKIDDFYLLSMYKFRNLDTKNNSKEFLEIIKLIELYL